MAIELAGFMAAIVGRARRHAIAVAQADGDEARMGLRADNSLMDKGQERKRNQRRMHGAQKLLD